MKKLMILAASLTLLGSVAAMAGPRDRAGVYVGSDSFGIYLDSGSRDYDRGRHHDQRWRSPENRFGDWYADPNRYRKYNKARWSERDCYPVSRRAYDRRGQIVTHVATMCYRRNGDSYIVPGSSRVYR